MDRNNERENKTRIAHEFNAGNKILLKIPTKQRKHRNT